MVCTWQKMYFLALGLFLVVCNKWAAQLAEWFSRPLYGGEPPLSRENTIWVWRVLYAIAGVLCCTAALFQL